MHGTTRAGLTTLPNLQTALDGLGTEQALRLTLDDCDRLFGVNDALVARVANFARGHGCAAIWDESGLLFRRLPPAGAAPSVLPPVGERRD